MTSARAAYYQEKFTSAETSGTFGSYGKTLALQSAKKQVRRRRGMTTSVVPMGKRFIDGVEFFHPILDEYENEQDDPLIFYNQNEVQMIRDSRHWMGDSTWKACQD